MSDSAHFNNSDSITDAFSVQNIKKEIFNSNQSLPFQISSTATGLYIIEGCLLVTIKQQTFQLNKGDSILIFQKNPYQLSTSDDVTCHFYTLNLSFSFIETPVCQTLTANTYLNTLRFFSFRYKNFLLFKSNEEIHRIFDNMYSEYHSKNIYCKEFFDLYSALLLLHMYRECEFNFARKELYTNTHFIAALEFLDSNYMNKITVKDISGHCNISSCYLSKLLHSALGISPAHFIVSFRIDKSLEMMTMGEYTLSEIASSVGFSSLQHFSKAFKSEIGMTPKKYQLLLNATSHK